MAKAFEELDCWNLAANLDAEVFEFIHSSRICKEFAIKDQMLRSSGSIADNIAEGFERGGNKEFIQYLYISKGSCGELRSQFHRCMKRKMITAEEFQKYFEKCKSTSGKISALITYLKSSSFKGDKYVKS